MIHSAKSPADAHRARILDNLSSTRVESDEDKVEEPKNG
jgi:hypothetical protein